MYHTQHLHQIYEKIVALQKRYDLHNEELDDNALIVLLQVLWHPTLV